MFVASGFVVFLYEFGSLILPLKISWQWQAIAACIIFTGACRNSIYALVGGRMFFTPEWPMWLLLAISWFYAASMIAFFLLAAKDAAWLLWKLFIRSRPFPAGYASAIVIAASLILSFYGTWAAMKLPDVKYEEAAIKGLPQELVGLKIALLADLHISAMNTESLIAGIADRTNAQSPDIILLAGDMIDGSVADRADAVRPLARLNAKYGVYGTAGNHEYYSGYGDWKNRFEELGITMLDNSHDVVEAGSGKLVIAGVPDKHAARFGYDGPDAGIALNGAPKDAPVILLAHRPDGAALNEAVGADIQLSGHTHGGMVLGFDRLIARFNGGYVRGWYNIGNMKLYVSPGTLLWEGFALRLGIPSEITVFTLTDGG